ncbi:hypothetical protein GCM10025789_30390 [Tessaracoccus lubricantis]|uniref:Uncharacterized protein n=1 Tax=Tessaracoccus lubricantis TaxID=545543 RepID=A0ABP9FM93_9ACTN
MMKVGEAANRLAKLEVLPPKGVRWAIAIANRDFLIHQYDDINRDIRLRRLSGTGLQTEGLTALSGDTSPCHKPCRSERPVAMNG